MKSHWNSQKNCKFKPALYISTCSAACSVEDDNSVFSSSLSIVEGKILSWKVFKIFSYSTTNQPSQHDLAFFYLLPISLTISNYSNGIWIVMDRKTTWILLSNLLSRIHIILLSPMFQSYNILSYYTLQYFPIHSYPPLSHDNLLYPIHVLPYPYPLLSYPPLTLNNPSNLLDTNSYSYQFVRHASFSRNQCTWSFHSLSSQTRLTQSYMYLNWRK